jgi:hypothetical protein
VHYSRTEANPPHLILKVEAMANAAVDKHA